MQQTKNSYKFIKKKNLFIVLRTVPAFLYGTLNLHHSCNPLLGINYRDLKTHKTC